MHRGHVRRKNQGIGFQKGENVDSDYGLSCSARKHDGSKPRPRPPIAQKCLGGLFLIIPNGQRMAARKLGLQGDFQGIPFFQGGHVLDRIPQLYQLLFDGTPVNQGQEKSFRGFDPVLIHGFSTGQFLGDVGIRRFEDQAVFIRSFKKF